MNQPSLSDTHGTEKRIVLNVVDDSTTDSDDSDRRDAHGRSERPMRYVSFREMYYNTPQYTCRKKTAESSSAANEKDRTSATSNATNNAAGNVNHDKEEKQPEHDVDSSETEEIVAPSDACSTRSESSRARREELKPHGIQSISTVSRNSGYRKFEFQQFNTGYSMPQIVYIRDRSSTKLAAPPPKPSYSINSNAKQADIVSSARIAGYRQSRGSMLCRGSIRPENLILEGGPQLNTLASLKPYMDIERLKDIVNSAVGIVRNSHDMSRFKINSTAYISISHKDFSKGIQDINLFNSRFCSKVFVMQSLSTLVYYAHNGTAHIVFHDRTRLLINKNYTSYSILVFTHDKSLSQESIDAQNGITYHTNGIVVETPRETTRIILPNSIAVKSTVHTLDCFIVWRF